jgi:hypothetical protein
MKGFEMKTTVYKQDLERKFIEGNFPYQPSGTLFDYEGSGRDIEVDVTLTRKSLLEMYFDYVNNYLTIEKFAEHRGLYVYEAAVLIDLAKRCLESPHPDS